MGKEIFDEKKKMFRQRILVVSLVFIAFLFGWAFGHLDFQRNMFGYLPGATDNQKRPNFELFWSAWDKVTSEFDGPIDSQKLIYGAISGMVNALGDPYTAFFTPAESESFNQQLEGTISGIGAEIGIKSDRPVIISPIADSPAQKAGIRAQDVIIKIDDTDTKNMDVNTAVSKIRGQAGTKVKLTVARGDKTLEFTITRENIQVKSVKYEIKDGNIGYVQISRFDSNTADLLKEANKDLKSKGVKGIILDLRNNPGGYLDAAVEVSSEYIDKGTIVIEKKNGSNKKEEYKASGKGTFTDSAIPMVVLVNGGSASASEIVAGAIQDYGRGTLVGEKTFGKGSVQAVENLGGGSSLHITIAHWYTPKNRSINKEGLSPEVQSGLSEDDYNNNRDPQMDKALEYLKSKVK